MGIHVLVVDDNADSRDLLAALLRYHGATVIATQSAHEALLRLEHGRPDVIVSDLSMPELTGYDMMERVRALPKYAGRPIPAIALTAYVSAEAREAALGSGFQAFYTKPLDVEALVNEIGRLVTRAA